MVDKDVTISQLVNVIQKASAAFETPYTELREALVQEPYVGSDESGHKDGGMKHWAWCFRAARFTVFHIDPSRSSDVLKAILTETFGGVVGSDYFSAYHKYMADCGVLVQFCWAHLIRDIRFLAGHPPCASRKACFSNMRNAGLTSLSPTCYYTDQTRPQTP